MGAQCKVIPLKTAMTEAYEILGTKSIVEHVDAGEKAALINKALCVLKEMEEEWETDHYSPGIRDKIHLLAYYLGKLALP